MNSEHPEGQRGFGLRVLGFAVIILTATVLAIFVDSTLGSVIVTCSAVSTASLHLLLRDRIGVWPSATIVFLLAFLPVLILFARVMGKLSASQPVQSRLTTPVSNPSILATQPQPALSCYVGK